MWGRRDEGIVMKKKIVAFLCILLLSSCGFRHLLDLPDPITETWQIVYVNDVGSFRIPIEWYAEQEDKILYITDKPRKHEGYSIILIGVTHPDGTVFKGINELFDNVEIGNRLWDIVFANSSSLRVFECGIDKENENHLVIEMPRIEGGFDSGLHHRFYLLALNQDAIDEHLASEIAKTFKMERQDM
jgi:hypothetical protein